MSGGFKPIDTSIGKKLVSSSDLDVELEAAREPEDTSKEVELEAEEQVEAKDIEVDLDESKVSEEEEEVNETKKKVGRPKGSTNKKRDKRIKQLLDKAKEAEERAKQAEAKAQKLEKSYYQSMKSTAESKRDTLEKHLGNLQEQLASALEDEDNAKAAQIQREMMQTEMEYASLNYQLSNTKELVDIPDNPPQQEEASQYALDWVEDHPEFNTDVEFHQASLGVNQKLLQEGYDPDSEDFYEELDSRLSRRYPEYYDTYSENVVQSDVEEQNSSRASSSGRTENSSESEDYPQTVAGASRTPTGSTSTKKGRKTKNTIILTPEDQEIAKNWQMDPVTFAKRKHLLESKAKGEYTPIFIERSE